MTSKYLFIDIDGVLNDPGCWSKRPEHKAINPALVARLRALVEATGAKCVLSSTWRFAYSLERTLEALAVNGWPDVRDHFVGETPVCHDRTRGYEIVAWLKENGDPGNMAFAVLDDCTQSDSPEFEFRGVIDNWVIVDGSVGLQDADCAKALELLGA